MNILSIPQEMNHEIAQWLSPIDIVRFRKTCKAIYNMHAIEVIMWFKTDWEQVDYTRPLPNHLLEKYPNLINWDRLCVSGKLSEEFIEEYSDYVSWPAISLYQILSEGFVDKHTEQVDWNVLIVRQNLSQEFIDKKMALIDWKAVSSYYICEHFIEKYADKLDWDQIARSYSHLSEVCIERCEKYVNWDSMFSYRMFSKGFIEKHGHKSAVAPTCLSS